MPARRHPDTGEWIIPEEERLFIPQPELAAKLGVSNSTVSRWVVKGILPHVVVDGRRHIRRDLVFDWFDEQTSLGRMDELMGMTSCPHCNKPVV